MNLLLYVQQEETEKRFSFAYSAKRMMVGKEDELIIGGYLAANNLQQATYMAMADAVRRLKEAYPRCKSIEMEVSDKQIVTALQQCQDGDTGKIKSCTVDAIKALLKCVGDIPFRVKFSKGSCTKKTHPLHPYYAFVQEDVVPAIQKEFATKTIIKKNKKFLAEQEKKRQKELLKSLKLAQSGDAELKVYTDGSYQNQNNRGGYAYIIKLNGQDLVDDVKIDEGLNSSLEAEIKAATEGLKRGAKFGAKDVVLYTDCQAILFAYYFKEKMLKRIKKNNLVSRYYDEFYRAVELYECVHITYQKGHSSGTFVEECDRMINRLYKTTDAKAC